MSVTDSLYVKLYDFRTKTRQQPTAIYVGYRTRKVLLSEVGILQHVTTRGERLEFSGLPIFIVDEENYLAVG